MAESNRKADTARNLYRQGMRAAAISIAISGSLSLAKIVAGIMGNSAAAIADGIESGCDMLTSAILFGGLAISLRPADSRHQYGYERAESISATTLAALLTVTGLSVIIGATRQFGAEHVKPALYTMWPVMASVGLKGSLAVWKWRLTGRSGSSSLKSEAFNDSADVISGLVAITGIYLARKDPVRFADADQIAAAIVGLLIISVGVRIFRRSFSELMDEAPPDSLRKKIVRIALQTPGVASVEKCLGRRSGTGYFIDIHIKVPPNMTVLRAHAISHKAKARLLKASPLIRDVLTHIEPANSGSEGKQTVKL